MQLNTGQGSHNGQKEFRSLVGVKQIAQWEFLHEDFASKSPSF